MKIAPPADSPAPPSDLPSRPGELQGTASLRSSAQLAVDSRCELGEGIVWCDRRGGILWTDIHGSRLWLYRPAGGETRSWKLADRLGSFALCESGKLLLALAKGLYLADPDAASGEALPAERLCAVEAGEPRTRTNDGRADRDGNFVFGTINEAPSRAPIGRFYQYSQRHGLRPLNLPGVAIPNSLAFSLDGSTIYFCDTLDHRILCGDYDAERARVSHVRLFATVDDAGPDGSTVDADGCLWNAQWGGARVVRYAPDGGIERVITLPVPQPSCVAFGGEALDTLYVTTAREHMSEAALATAPQSGGVFGLRLGDVFGLPESRFRDA